MARPSRAEALDWIVERPRTAKVGVVGPDGGPHVTPVWVARDGDDLVFNTGEMSGKGRALRRDPRIALCFDDEAPPFDFVTVFGTVEIVEDLDEVRRWATVIGGRYMGEDRAEEFGERNGVPGELVVRVAVDRVVGGFEVAD